MVTFFEYQASYWLVTYENGVLLGEAAQIEDGFVYFWFDERKGFIDASVLRQIADTLDFINEPWNKTIEEFFALK